MSKTKKLIKIVFAIAYFFVAMGFAHEAFKAVPLFHILLYTLASACMGHLSFETVKSVEK